MTSKKFWLGMLVLVLAFGMSVIGCEDDDGGGNIVNRSGEAWVAGNDGYIFRSDGTFDVIYSDGIWDVEDSGTYKTSGSKLILTLHETATSSYSYTVEYSVSGNTLKLTFSYEGYYSETSTYTKTNIGSIGVFTPPANHTSLTNGQWMNGSIDSYGEVKWYSFNVVAGTTYRVWWNESYSGSYFDLMVSAFYSNGTRIFS